MSFAARLHEGQIGESEISLWMIDEGWSVLPVYEKEIDNGKGPRLFTTDGQFVAPDMFVFRGVERGWIEAKHKSAMTYHRLTDHWVTGIDFKHWQDYQEVARRTAMDVWLFFLQRGGQAKDSPPNSPSGLFGAEIKELMRQVHHVWADRMVYWAPESDGGPLKLFATLDEFNAAVERQRRKLELLEVAS